ncbi:MAG: YitT family protein [Actinobacteria bacterium]|nr:YitT family protein [Actinomycetota bacterium]
MTGGAIPGEYTGRLPFRYLVFALGMFVMAIGIAVTVRAALGTTPISTPPYVVSLGGGVTLGVATIVMHVAFVTIQIALLRRDFEWIQLLQVLVGVGFGVFIDAAMWLTRWFDPGPYWLQWVGVLVGSAILAFGISLQFVPKVLMNAGEGTVAALAHVTGVRIGTMKIIFDVSLVGIGAVISLAMFGRIEGIREGTLVAMFLVGLIVGRILPPLTRWFAGLMHQPPGDTPPEIAPDMSA